ncbi:MAG: class I SAM-dependent methyltransferase [Chloroflexi bacterium]|nr:class I SAM-dependent methyltransferase [Chloroflexota bacterium]
MRNRLVRLAQGFAHPMLVSVYNASVFRVRIDRVLYLRIVSLQQRRNSHIGVDGVFSYMDEWVRKRSRDGYVPEDFTPPQDLDASSWHGIQQVRREIREFVEVLLAKGLTDTMLDIGLGHHGGSHMLWRQIFDKVVTIELDPVRALNFKLSEWLNSRSMIVIGRSEDPRTLDKVRQCTDSVDVLFIDGDHTYDAVRNDYLIYRNVVKSGGIIGFHDCVCRLPDFGVADFLDDLAAGMIDDKPHEIHSIVYSDHVGIAYEVC